MESIEKLRELAADINGTEIIAHIDLGSRLAFHSEWLDSWHKAFDAACDEIEREIAERYMELPLDADGVPIRVGDEINSLGCGVLVNSIIWDGKNWYASETVSSSDWFPVKYSDHAKPRTLEDVLREMLDRNSDGIGLREFNRDFNALVEHYAAEIRELRGDAE